MGITELQMGIYGALSSAVTGLRAQSHALENISGNIANSHTTLDEDGNKSPFQRRMVIMESETSSQSATRGVGVRAEVELDTESVPRKIHDPGHPHADAEGYVTYPNINVITEFVNALEATRAYEANLSAMQVTRNMIDSTFRIIG